MSLTPTDSTALVQALLQRIGEDHRAGTLPLPGLPGIALKVRRAVEDDSLGAADLARLIQMDPVLTARIIQAANNATYGGLPAVTSCLGAVARFGMRGVRDRVVAFSLKEVFDSPLPAVKGRLKQVWQHSVRVAAISHVLARIGPNLDPERALLAGLVHDIGELPLLAYTREFPELAQDKALLDRVVKRLRGRLGGMVLQAWKFETDLVHCALEAELWTRDPRPMPDYVDVVLLANVFSGFGGSATRSPPIASLPAFQKFPLGALGPEGGVEVLEEAADAIRAMMQLLEG